MVKNLHNHAVLIITRLGISCVAAEVVYLIYSLGSCVQVHSKATDDFQI